MEAKALYGTGMWASGTSVRRRLEALDMVFLRQMAGVRRDLEELGAHSTEKKQSAHESLVQGCGVADIFRIGGLGLGTFGAGKSFGVLRPSQALSWRGGMLACGAQSTRSASTLRIRSPGGTRLGSQPGSVAVRFACRV